MINDKPHWYTTEYLNRFNVQLLTESDKSEAEEDTVIFHGPFKTVEEAIEFASLSLTTAPLQRTVWFTVVTADES